MLYGGEVRRSEFVEDDDGEVDDFADERITDDCDESYTPTVLDLKSNQLQRQMKVVNMQQLCRRTLIKNH